MIYGSKNNDQSYIGEKFGRLTVIGFSWNGRRWNWICRCECGNTKAVNPSRVKAGDILSCGCYHRELCIERSKKLKHAFNENKRLYGIHQAMKARCYNKNSSHYSSYGGRGIKICDEWIDEENGFDNFADWAISNGYTDELSIERVDVNGDYTPENCTWITMNEQSTNKRSTVWVEYHGEHIQLIKLCKRLCLNYKMVYDRIFVQGMSVEDAISTPVGGHDNLFRKCREKGINYQTIRARVKSGWDEERALNTPIRHWEKTKKQPIA